MERMTENEIDESSTAEVFSVVQIEGKSGAEGSALAYLTFNLIHTSE